MMHSKILTDMFVLALPVAEKILRPIVVYLFLVLGLRLAGKRELAQLNPFDLVVLLTLSNTVQNAIIGDDNSVTGGLIGAATLLLLNFLVVRFLFRHEKLDRLVEGEATVLMDNGKVLEDQLAKEVLTVEELQTAAHKQGFGDLREVDRATLDPSGMICFTAKKPVPEESRHREVLERLDQLARELATLKLRAAPPAP
ncbi:MAG TPA: YetF domain-containing protein [Candidatus Acidoferrales bacterium]|nr:YetF domain-containing protein [Candidatus Acidoferrales bacterium]